MRLLFLSAWCPWPADNGSKLRIYHLLRGLGQRHQVDLLSFCPDPLSAEQRAHLHNLCKSVQLVPETPFASRRLGHMLGMLSGQPRSLVGNHSRAMDGLVRRYMEQRPYDLVIASQLHMLPYVAHINTVPWLLEEAELAMFPEELARREGLGRLRARLTWYKTSSYLRRLLRRCAGASVVSEAERALLSRIAPASLPVRVVPNGVDVAGSAHSYGAPEPDTLIYPGALSYDANFDAVAYCLREIMPRIRKARSAARLRVTGKVTPEQIAALPQVEGLELTGYLDDVRPAIAGAWAEIVPLREGGGTRLKVLEALALGTPVVSTSKGVEGLDLRAGQGVLLADDPAEFAAQTLGLLESAELRAELSAQGRRAVQRYDWSYSLERLEELLELALRRAHETRGPAWRPEHSR
jgi:glycosyltransferase involved in cell wall biosynthesis